MLTLAGHDPSAGAGLSADLKTMEQNGVYGLSVCTALTIQNDKVFSGVEWIEKAFISKQISILKEAFSIDAVKIGLIENWKILTDILFQFEQIPIVFDPILEASAGFEFHQYADQEQFYELLKKVTLLTPNREEIIKLIPFSSPETAARLLSEYCAVLLKGGHHQKRLGEDELWKDGKRIAIFKAKNISKSAKHGSGCVLSAAIASELAKGNDLVIACQKAKDYIEQFLNSNSTLLGYHAQ